jgi:hypothetical protein
MARSKLLVSLLVLIGVCTLAGTSVAAPQKCPFNGDYSFFFWDPASPLAGVGYFSVVVSPATKCRSGIVLPGGIIDCNLENDTEFEDFIENGLVFLETDGEGTMEIETNSSHGICATGKNAIELDISVVQGGKRVLFNSDGEQFAGSGLIPQAGYDFSLTGRADKCFAGQISGCYDVRFWAGGGLTFGTINEDQRSGDNVGDCTICVNGAGSVTGGSCRCNSGGLGGSLETLSEIETGGYTLGENCESSTGYLWFTTSSDLICDEESSLALDFAVALGGTELIGACDPAEHILNGTSMINAGFFIPCAFEGLKAESLP